MSAPPKPPTPRWRFGPFEADAQEMQLRRAGSLVPVTRKAFALLTTLLAQPGRLLTKAELFDTVWAGTVVTDAALSRAVRELRVALGDDAGEPRYIATAHGLGFRFVAAVQEITGTDAATAAPHPPPPAMPTAATPPAAQPAVVGRDSELAALQSAWSSALAGRRQTVFVSGEAGIGKTALVQGFIGSLDAGANWIVQGRCIEQYGTGEAYLPLLEVLESLARQAGNDTLRRHLLRFAPAWLAQLPWLAHDADPAALAHALAGNSALRMLREISHALEVLASQRPLLLWLEDLHWSDPSTLDVLAFLAARSEPARLLVVASFRPEDAAAGAGPRSPLQRLAQRLHAQGQAQALVLALWGPDEIAACLRRRLGGALDLDADELARYLHRRTEGNALFTLALIDDLQQGGQLIETAQGWRLAAAVGELGSGVPASLRQLLQRQLDQLAEGERRLIEAAAVAGTDFCAAAVAAALQREPADVEEACLALAERGQFLRRRAAVVWPDGTESAGFGFVHALYWQGSYEGVAPSRRAEWHRRIGEREEQAWGDQVAAIAAELAMRFEAARDIDRCLRHLHRAGQAALARCAYAECADLLRHALDLVGRLPPEQQARREFELRLPLGAALMALHGYAAAEVEATYRRALDVGRRCASAQELERALRGLWNVALVRGELDRARTAADELVLHSAASGDPGTAFDAFAKLGQTQMHRGDFGLSRQHLEYALALPLAADDATLRRESPRVAAYLAWDHWYLGQPARARQFADDSLARAAGAASAHSTAFALGFAGWVYLFCGHPARTLELAQQQAAVAEEHGLAYWLAWSRVLAGLVRAGQGDAQGLALAGRGIDEFEAMDAVVGVSHFLCSLAEAQLDAGRPESAAALLDRSARWLEKTGNGYHAAEIARLRGRLAPAGSPAARAQFEAAVEQARRQAARALELRAATDLAQWWAQQGDRGTAMTLLGHVLAGFDAGETSADVRRARDLFARWPQARGPAAGRPGDVSRPGGDISAIVPAPGSRR